jgi:hypothetical protein
VIDQVQASNATGVETFLQQNAARKNGKKSRFTSALS